MMSFDSRRLIMMTFEYFGRLFFASVLEYTDGGAAGYGSI